MRSRKSSPVLVIAGIITIGALAVSGPAAVAHHDDEAQFQTPAEAKAADRQLLADTFGWTVAEIEAEEKADKEIAKITSAIRSRRPDIYIGAALSKTPGGAPTIYIKGTTPTFAKELVVAAAVPIKIVDQQPYSFDELQDRAWVAHEALVNLGYKQVFTAVDIAGAGRIPAGVKVVSGRSNKVADIVAALPKSVRSDVDLVVNTESIVTFDNSKGGSRIRSTQTGDVCTSGWAVERISDGKKGLVSAGHCGEMNRVHVSNSHKMWFKEEHGEPASVREYGDVEWYTTDANEVAQFRASPTAIRDVLWREKAEDIEPDNKYCLYGKSSNKQACLKVQYAWAQCTGEADGSTVTYKRMVSMNDDVGVPGDSGGPWFIFNKAVGVHHGTCGNRPNKDAFSKIDLLDEAMGIRVMKQ